MPSALMADLILTIPSPLWHAMQECDFCVSACCGTGAYDLSPVHMWTWLETASERDVEQAVHQLEELIGRAQTHSGPVQLEFFSDRFEVGEVAKWLDEVRECLLYANSHGDLSSWDRRDP